MVESESRNVQKEQNSPRLKRLKRLFCEAVFFSPKSEESNETFKTTRGFCCCLYLLLLFLLSLFSSSVVFKRVETPTAKLFKFVFDFNKQPESSSSSFYEWRQQFLKLWKRLFSTWKRLTRSKWSHWFLWLIHWESSCSGKSVRSSIIWLEI